MRLCRLDAAPVAAMHQCSWWHVVPGPAALAMPPAVEGCGAGPFGGGPNPTPARNDTEHRDPAGISLRKPPDWRVQSDGAGDLAISDPLGHAAALVRTRRVPPHAALVQWLERRYAATEAGLHHVRMLAALAHSPQVALAVFDYGGHVFQGRASAVAVRNGDAATLFIAAAARPCFARALPDLSRILGSVRFGPAPQRRCSVGATAAPDPRAGLDMARLLRIDAEVPPPPR